MNRDQAFRMAMVVERMARTDAGAWVKRLRQQAHLVAHGRAAQVIEPHKTTPDRRGRGSGTCGCSETKPDTAPADHLVLNPDGPQQAPRQNGYTDRAEDDSARDEPAEEWHRDELNTSSKPVRTLHGATQFNQSY